ncbi:MAG: 6,7-dimethyl-8-ribityllumazine synthase [Chitinophagia bacterium]|nr:6,7-dimethyl-8-ribityllumazine synthase [Chitinophagia bacterium]
MSTSTSNLYNTSGILLPKDACVVIVRTEWNADTIDQLEKGCLKVLEEKGVSFKILTVPGAFEIAFCIKNYWDKFKYREQKPHAFIALGCIIRGGTPHFDYVCKAVTEGVVLLNNSLPVPTIFGVLTVDNQQQIDERTGGVHGNKGEEAAIAALKMIALNYSLK